MMKLIPLFAASWATPSSSLACVRGSDAIIMAIISYSKSLIPGASTELSDLDPIVTATSGVFDLIGS